MEKLSNAEIVYNKLKKTILSCEYEPGELVSEKEIVERFGTSRTPVREAISMLSGQGLLDILPKKGVQISKISLRKLKEVYELRKILEPIAVRQAMDYVTEEDIENLSSLEVQLKSSGENEDVFSLFSKGMDYHLYVAKLSRNETLFNILKILREESYRGLTYYLKSYLKQSTPAERKEIMAFVGHEHIAITDAFRTRDLDAAVDAIIKDLSSMDDVIRSFSQQ